MCQEVIADYMAEWENMLLQENQNQFIACAWITNKENRMFHLFPHVIIVDITKYTNKEDQPLLTVSMRTTLGNYMVIMQMFLPNEQKITFKWVFSVTIPTLV